MDVDQIRRLGDAAGLDLPEEDLVPLASALTDRLKEIRSFARLALPSDGSETHFDVSWNL